MDSSFDVDGSKDARPEDKISNFEACLEKTLLSIKQEKFYSFGRAAPKEISSPYAFNPTE
jgi:hypothetical protein